MAYSMVSVYGMNPELGLLSYGQNNSSEQFYKPYSEETGQMIDREARSIVDEQYERVKVLLVEKTSIMNGMADALAEKETLVYNDLRELCGERPWALKSQYSKFITASGNPYDQAATEEESKENVEAKATADAQKETADKAAPSESAAPDSSSKAQSST